MCKYAQRTPNNLKGKFYQMNLVSSQLAQKTFILGGISNFFQTFNTKTYCISILYTVY